MKPLLILSVAVVFSFQLQGQDPIPSKDPMSFYDVRDEIDDKNLNVHFIDVGAGMAMFIQTPSGKTIFVDGGKGDTDDIKKVGEYVDEFMGDKETIDLAIVTHADADHFRGMISIFKNYQVKEFWYNGFISQTLNLERTQWLEFMLLVKKERRCEDIWILRKKYKLGQKIVFDHGESSTKDDDITITLLNMDDNPPHKDPDNGRKFKESERRNDASIVFKLAYGKTSFLITGDINGREKWSDKKNHDSKEKELVDRANKEGGNFKLDATVLQTPHHGSDGSASTKFLEAVNPKYMVIPAGAEYGHPHKPTMKRLKKVIDEEYILSTNEGDENDHEEPKFDDNLIFSVSQEKITYIYRMKY